MLTHSKIPKFAFIGTSSSGKTTATYQACAFLKEHGVRVDGILQQDRRLPFDPRLLETHAEAQYWFVTNIMTVESYLALQRGVDCIVSDRSVVDFFAYAKTQWPGDMNALESMISSWATTYTKLFYMPPRAYDADGVRPSDEFRLRVDCVLTDLVSSLQLEGVEISTPSSWKEAAREIAVHSKRMQLHPNAVITGSWNSGKFKPGSDFDFILSDADWQRVPSEVKAKFAQVDHLPYVEKFKDEGLIALFRSEELNMDVQIQNPDYWERRCAANALERGEP